MSAAGPASVSEEESTTLPVFHAGRCDDDSSLVSLKENALAAPESCLFEGNSDSWAHNGGPQSSHPGGPNPSKSVSFADHPPSECGDSLVSDPSHWIGGKDELVADGDSNGDSDSDSDAALSGHEIREIRSLLRVRKSAASAASSSTVRSANRRKREGLAGSILKYSWGESISMYLEEDPDLIPGEDDGDEDRGTGLRLPPDTYSMIHFARPNHPAFALSVCTFLLQATILALILADVADMYRLREVGLDLPTGVSDAVRASQFLAIVVSVAAQDDLITAINTLHLGYPSVLMSDDGNGAEGREAKDKGRRWRWMLGLFLRATEGAGCLVVTFILIMQANDVTGMFVDFLAVTFVNGIDDSVFVLARSGFFGRAVKRESRDLGRVRVPRKREETYWFRRIVFLLVSAVMLMGWGLIGRHQRQGRYLPCRNIIMEFGDEFHSTLGFFNGPFLFLEMDQSGRPIYVTGPRKNQQFYARISYCHNFGAWTVAPINTDGSYDPCNWFAITTETDAYDIMNIPVSEWQVYLDKPGENKRGAPFQHFAIYCNGCEDSAQASCGAEGVCVNNECSCNDGFFGPQCQYNKMCEEIEVNEAFSGGFSGSEDWAGEYHILHRAGRETPVIVNAHPIYVEAYEDYVQHVLIFTGRRWYFTKSLSIMNGTAAVSEEELADYLNENFNEHWTDLNPEMVSSAVDLLTPSERREPLGLFWYHPEVFGRVQKARFSHENLLPTETRLHCSACSDREHPCLNGGQCSENRTCVCPLGTYGTRCQVSSFDLCTSFDIHIEDAVSQYTGGTYDLNTGTVLANRPVYVAREKQDGMIVYCFEDSVWVLLLSDEDGDPCSGWYARSGTTFEYDILRTKDWVIRESASGTETRPLSDWTKSVTCNGDY